jgi:hypothetical protein
MFPFLLLLSSLYLPLPLLVYETSFVNIPVAWMSIMGTVFLVFLSCLFIGLLPDPKPVVKPGKKPNELKATKHMSVSPASSKGSGGESPRVPTPPNLVLPTWDDTFLSPPRSTVHRLGQRPETSSTFMRMVHLVSGMLFAGENGTSTGKDKALLEEDGSFADFGRDLPRSWDVIGERLDGDILRGCRCVVVIGVHGWFPGTSANVHRGKSGGQG